MKEKQVQALSERSSCSTAATVQLKSTATESSLNPEDGSDDDDHLSQKIILLKSSMKPISTSETQCLVFFIIFFTKIKGIMTEVQMTLFLVTMLEKVNEIQIVFFKMLFLNRLPGLPFPWS